MIEMSAVIGNQHAKKSPIGIFYALKSLNTNRDANSLG